MRDIKGVWNKNDFLFWVIFTFAYVVLASIVAFTFDGTGDAGDSILHYLYARYAPVQPELYLNHWAKPLFTIVASPIAQLPFQYFKLFNALLLWVTMFFTTTAAKHVKLRNHLLTPIFLLASPLVFSLSFSGLTEPLFAAILSVALLLLSKQKTSSALILLSFLPFVRSEGLIVIAATFIWLLPHFKWKQLLQLSVGHLVFSFVGWFFTKDVLWVFSENPYAHLSSVYGSGRFFHFFRQMPFVVGTPNAILMGIGLICVITKWQIKSMSMLQWAVLVFLLFFFGHVAFWYLGIFNSFGLKRVFLAISPIMTFLMLVGANRVTAFSPNQFKMAVLGVVIGVVISFPFWNNPAALNPQQDLELNADQRLQAAMCKHIDTYFPNRRLINSHPYVSLVLDYNHFDTKARIDITKDNIEICKQNDLILWENHIAQNDYGVTFSDLDQNAKLKLLHIIQSGSDSAVLFERVDRNMDVVN